MDDNLYDYSVPVYRVLLKNDQTFGIGMMPFLAIAVFTALLMSMISVFCIAIGLALYIVCRVLCKKDTFMISILFERITQPEIWRCD